MEPYSNRYLSKPLCYEVEASRLKRMFWGLKAASEGLGCRQFRVWGFGVWRVGRLGLRVWVLGFRGLRFWRLGFRNPKPEPFWGLEVKG